MEAETEVSQPVNSDAGDGSQAIPGEKKKGLWKYLQTERVGQELFLTAGHLKEAACAIGCSKDYIYQLFSKFEKEGLMVRRVQKGKGTTITFLSTKKEDPSSRSSSGKKIQVGVSNRFPPSTTLAEALEVVEHRIERLETELAANTIIRLQLRTLTGKEKS